MICMVLVLTSLGDGSKETEKKKKKLGSTSDGDAPAARKLAFKTSSWMRKQVFVSVGVSGGCSQSPGEG